MEINYELIIKYLVNNKKNASIKKNNFITQKDIFNYSVNFPDIFKNLFTDKFYRYGITVYDNEHNNISFWSSVLTLIDKNFLVPYSNSEEQMINQFKTQLIDKYAKSRLSAPLRKIEKSIMRERFNLQQDIYILQYLVDILDINILIFNFETCEINIVYYKNILNPFKKTLLLAKYKEHWEPIAMEKQKGKTKRLFDYNDNIIKKILSDYQIEYFEGNKINKEYILGDVDHMIQTEYNKQVEPIEPVIKPTDIINNEVKNDSESSVKTDLDSANNISDETNIFIKPNELEELRKLNKTKLTKMRLEELYKIVDKLKIIIATKNPTKSVIIEAILLKLSNLDYK